MLSPLFCLRQYVEASALQDIYIAEKSYPHGFYRLLSIVPLTLEAVRAPMEQSRCTKRKLQLELINADSQLQWLAEQHPESAFTIQQLQDKMARIFHLSEGLDVDEFCRNPFQT